MYVFGGEQTITGDIAAIWAVWTDMPRFPDWDPREEQTRLDGPFQPGTSGYSKQRGNPGGPFTLAAVEPQRRWTVQSALPGGTLIIDHLVEPAGDGKVRVGKRYEVRGPLIPLFRLWYGPRVRRALGGTFTALEREVARRG
jgi:Polyketide cyclase / dehydrase and lipid transport